MLDELFLKIDDFVKREQQRYVYCGSISLWLNGMKNEITEFHDIDVDFIDLTEAEKIWMNIDYSEKLAGDKLRPIPGIPIRYHSIIFNDREILVSDLDYEIEVREWLINNIENYSHKDKALKRIEQIKNFIKRNETC